MNELLIGHDTEFFLEKQGVIVPSQGIIPGTKRRPKQLAHCVVHRDNAAGEFGTAPAATVEEFVASVTAGIAEIEAQLNPRGVEIVWKASHEFTEEQLTHPEVNQFACDVDYDAYTLEIGQGATIASAGLLRSAGGHLHFSYDYDGIMDRILALRGADATVGLLSVLYDNDTKRRKLYGQAGRYRLKSYGAEYRTPSNFWCASEYLMERMFRAMKAAVVMREELSSLISEDGWENIQHAINASDQHLAQTLVDYYDIEEVINHANS